MAKKENPTSVENDVELPEKTEPKAKGLVPAFDTTVSTPEQIKGEKVKMRFPKPVLLTVKHGQQISFPAGVQHVPKSFADHPYLVANKVVAVSENDGTNEAA